MTFHDEIKPAVASRDFPAPAVSVGEVLLTLALLGALAYFARELFGGAEGAFQAGMGVAPSVAILLKRQLHVACAARKGPANLEE